MILDFIFDHIPILNNYSISAHVAFLEHILVLRQLHSVLEMSQVLVLELMSTVIRFALGSFAGACGATAVYPIDLGIIDKNDFDKFCGEMNNWT